MPPSESEAAFSVILILKKFNKKLKNNGDLLCLYYIVTIQTN